MGLAHARSPPHQAATPRLEGWVGAVPGAREPPQWAHRCPQLEALGPTGLVSLRQDLQDSKRKGRPIQLQSHVQSQGLVAPWPA